MISNKYMDILKLPLEILEKIFKFLNQNSLSCTCLVNKEWNTMVYSVWHTLDLSKSHTHFTHLASKVKSISKTNKSNRKIRVLESICNNLVSNNGFLIPPLSNKNGNLIFKKNYNSNKDNNSNNNSNTITEIASLDDISNKETILDDDNNNNNTKQDKNLQISNSYNKSNKLEKEIENRIEKRMEQFFKSICNRFERVEILDLSGCTDLKMDSIMLLVKSFSQTLKKLTTRRCKSPTITDEKFSQIFQYCKKLTTLSLGEMPLIGDKTITSLSRHCPNLEALGIARCYNITDLSITTLSKSNIQYTTSTTASSLLPSNYNKLRVIGLNHLSHLSDESILELGLSCSRSLHIFSVCNLVNLTSDTLSKIFLNCCLLGSIDLSGCVNTDDSVLESIAYKCNNLFQLNISRLPKVTSASLKKVAQHCKLLRILFISKTSIDDDSILYCIDNLNLLEILFSTHCNNITDISIKSILNLGTERLSNMIVNFHSCRNISTSLLSILQSLTKQQQQRQNNNNTEINLNSNNSSNNINSNDNSNDNINSNSNGSYNYSYNNDNDTICSSYSNSYRGGGGDCGKNLKSIIDEIESP